MPTVAVEFGIYHDPGKLACTRGMRLLTDQAARAEHLRPCSRCFPDRERRLGRVPNLRTNPNVSL